MKNPTFIIEMENNDVMKGELFLDKTPNTVRNFISLVNKKYYDGLVFHRVIKGFMLQGGCPDGTGMGGPGYSIKGEFSSNGFDNNIEHVKGVLSMARSQHPDSGGSQFFIMHETSNHLDGAYAAFGVVTEGLEIIDKIANEKTDFRDKPKNEQKIKSIRIELNGNIVEEPEIIK